MRSSKIQLRKLKLRLRDKRFANHKAPYTVIWQQPLQSVLALRNCSTMDLFYIGRRVIGISRSLIWSKTLIELIFNPCGEFWWSPEGPVSQVRSPILHADAPRIFSDLLSSIQMLKREWGAESNKKLPHQFIPSKIATLVPEFAVLSSYPIVLTRLDGPHSRPYTSRKISKV